MSEEILYNMLRACLRVVKDLKKQYNCLVFWYEISVQFKKVIQSR